MEAKFLVPLPQIFTGYLNKTKKIKVVLYGPNGDTDGLPNSEKVNA
jgi:hypothetical protein